MKITSEQDREKIAHLNAEKLFTFPASSPAPRACSP
jgi:hypothetical protein